MKHIKTLHANEPNEINTFQKGKEIIVETKENTNSKIFPYYLDELMEDLEQQKNVSK